MRIYDAFMDRYAVWMIEKRIVARTPPFTCEARSIQIHLKREIDNDSRRRRSGKSVSHRRHNIRE